MTRRLQDRALCRDARRLRRHGGAYQLGFDAGRPGRLLADGTSVSLRAADVQACFKARALALLGDQLCR